MHRLRAGCLILVIVAGCGAQSPTEPSPPTGSPGAEVPAPSGLDLGNTTQALIEQARAAGQIDLATALLYRAWAMTGDERLPQAYRGAGTLAHDPELFDIIADGLDGLPAETAAELGTLLLRPTDPRSAWAQDRPLTMRSPALAAGLAPVAQATPAPRECPARAWRDSGDASPRFKVWVCATVNEATVEQDIATVVAILDDIHGPMTREPPDGMGPPLPDTGGTDAGGDTRIDVYLLHPGWALYRTGERQYISGGIAAAIPAPPFHKADGNPSNSSSGFILIDRARIADVDDLRRSLIHELFHVLQMKHHRKTRVEDGGYHWIREATATWAESYYFRARSGPVHGWFRQTFDAGAPLAGQAAHDAAYVWFLFVEQELRAQTIFRTWQQVGGVRAYDLDAVTEVMDANASFELLFGEFALRNLNKPLTPGDPLDPRYVKLDPNFPDGVTPADLQEFSIAAEDRQRFPQRVASLSAQYLLFRPAPDVVDVTFDLTGLEPSGSLSAIALVLVDGQWKRQPVNGGVLRFCRTNPAEEFDELYIVLANHTWKQASAVQGDVAVETKGSCTGYDITYTYRASDGVGYEATGYLEPDEEGNLVGEVTVSGTYWVGTRITGGQVENCVPEPFTRELILYGREFPADNELLIYSEPREEDADLGLFTVSVGGTALMDGTPVTFENPPADEGGYGFGCSAFFHRTEVLTAKPR